MLKKLDCEKNYSPLINRGLVHCYYYYFGLESDSKCILKIYKSKQTRYERCWRIYIFQAINID